MKHLFIFSIAILMSVTAFSQQSKLLVPTTGKTIKVLVKEVKKKNAYLIDVRTPEEYKEDNLKFSKNIDYKSANFKAGIDSLDKNKAVYLYCRSGNRSGKALEILKTEGFTKVYNIGGFKDLVKLGLPTQNKIVAEIK